MAETSVLTIRPSNRHDLAEIDALLSRSYPALLKSDYLPSTLVTAVPLISRAKPELVVSGTYYVVQTVDKEIVGAGGWTRRGRRQDVADVRHVVTDHRRTRQGIGRMLLDQVFADAGAAGIRTLDCMATRTAVPFYQAMGFVSLGPIEVRLSGGITFPAIQMNRAL